MQFNADDCVFVMDATGSMSGVIAAAKEKVMQIAGQVSQEYPSVSFRYPSVAYRDLVQDGSQSDLFNFATDTGGLRDWLAGVRATGGGGDGPEDWVDAFRLLFSLSWRQQALRTVFWIADAPAHGRRWCGMDNRQEQEGLLEPYIAALAQTAAVFVGMDIGRGAGTTFAEMRKIWARYSARPFIVEPFTGSANGPPNALAQFLYQVSVMAVRETICPIASGITGQYSRPITPPPSPRVTPDVPSELSWLLSKYAIEERIGHGAFADVYSGSRRSDGVKIAVKQMLVTKELSRISFEREVAAMQNLSHPGCLKLLSVERRNDDSVLILPLMQGSLLGGLNRERAGAPFPEWQTTKMKCIIGVAFIMEYLHSLNWMHRDVKPENVLLDDSFDPVLSDFGTAKRLDQPDSVGVMTMAGTPFHMAPEVTSDDGYGKPADVFSYAVLLYRVFTDKLDLDDCKGPYKDRTNFIRRVTQGARYPAVPEIPAAYWQLITQCWDHSPSYRPTFKGIVDHLVTYRSSFMLPQSNESQVASYVNKMRQYRP
jgi:hypothetical protein